jgi:CRP-like cAMP-binding protein
MEELLKKISEYSTLGPEAELAWVKIIHGRKYSKGSFLVKSGEVAQKVAFVAKGLFSQYAVAEDGNMAIKRFFSEGYFAASTPSLLKKVASATTIEALEDSMVWEYDFWEFKALTERYPDIAAFYIRYMEQHWIIEKEPEELALRQYTAKAGYEDFVKRYPHLIKRIKKHHIAAYLGITPTQMSRIFFANK